MWFVHYSQDQKWFDFVVQPFFMKYISISLIRLQSDSGITCKFYTSSCSSRINVFQSLCCQWKKINVIIQLIQLLVVAGFVLLHFPDFVNQQVFSYTMLQQSTSLKAIVCCLIIIAGFFMGVDQEGVAGEKYFYE